MKAPDVHLEPLSRKGSLPAPDGRKFPWGPITRIYEIGPYQILEYKSDRSNLWPQTQAAVNEHGRSRFHPYIDGKDTCQSYRTLDSALVGAVAYRRAGPNSQAARHFDLMTLGVIPHEGDDE